MIEVNNVTKKFGDFVALDQLNMHVERGAIYGLVGPNGAGKSAIIRHLCGVFKQDSGTVLIDGQPVYENSQLKQRFTVIPDDIFYFTQANTLDMMKFYKNLYPKFDETLFKKIMDNGGYTTPVNQYPNGKSPFGVYDMSGNVWEWTSSQITTTNGAEKGQTVYAVKGGSWYANPNSCKITMSGEGRRPNTGYNTVGFRVVAVKKGATANNTC